MPNSARQRFERLKSSFAITNHGDQRKYLKGYFKFTDNQLRTERLLDVGGGYTGFTLREGPKIFSADPLFGFPVHKFSKKPAPAFLPGTKERGVQALAQNLPYKAESFHHAFSYYGVGFYRKIPLAESILEMLRIVKPGGTIRFMTPEFLEPSKLDSLIRILGGEGVRESPRSTRMDPRGWDTGAMIFRRPPNLNIGRLAKRLAREEFIQQQVAASYERQRHRR